MDIEQVRLHDISLQLDRPVLKDIQLIISKGIHCFLGYNGAGKSLTNKILALLLSPTSGEVYWDDLQVNPSHPTKQIEYRRHIGYMGQNVVFLNKSVEYNIELPLIIRNVAKQERKKLVQNKLREFNLKSLESKNPYKLSIGQRQKVALLRSIIHNPHILILDEPSASLDSQNTLWFESHIKELANDHRNIVVWTTHDQFQVKRIAETVSVFIDGRIEESGPTHQVLTSPRSKRVSRYLSGELV